MPIPTSRPAASRSLHAAAALSGLAWIALGAAFAAQLVFSGSFSWESAIRISIRDWLPWALLSPAVFALALTFPLERGHWIAHLPVHVAACLLSVMACEWLGHFLRPPAEMSPPFGTSFRPGGPPTHRGPPGPESVEDLQPGPGPGPNGGSRPSSRSGRPPRGDFGPNSGPNLPGLPGGALSARARLNVPVYWVVVCGAHALLFYRRSQERERRALELAASLAQAKLQALRMQLQPHFLFNTLNAISTLVHRDAAAADEMIGNLSDFLRLTLEHADRSELPLGEELEFVRRYLAIEQVRFGDRLQVEYDVPSDLYSLPVPTLILQPLVENALRHGLEPQTGGGQLRIVARRLGSRLRLSVIDNGRGLPALAPQRIGIGVANTRERLRERFGVNAGAELILEAAPGGGTAALLTLPIETVVAKSQAVAPTDRR